MWCSFRINWVHLASNMNYTMEKQRFNVNKGNLINDWIGCFYYFDANATVRHAHINSFLNVLYIHTTLSLSHTGSPIVGLTHSTRRNCVIMTYHMVHSIQNDDNRVDNCFISFSCDFVCAIFTLLTSLVGSILKKIALLMNILQCNSTATKI